MAARHFIGSNGHRIAATDLGEGPPVLLLHGGGQTRGSWKATAERIAAEGYRAVTIDARGHGESDWSQEGYGFSVLADDLRAVIRAVGGRPALVGASLGGLTALIGIGESDEPLASALVLVDITPRINAEGGAAVIEFMSANQDGFATLEEAADAVARYMTDRPRPRDISGLRRNLRERDGRLFWHWDPEFLRIPDDTGQGGDWERRLEAAARKVPVPTLLLRGEHSNVVDEAGVARLKELIPHAQVAEVSGAGHMIAGDANTPFADALIAFLRRVYPA